MANTLNLQRNGAVGFIDWLGLPSAARHQKYSACASAGDNNDDPNNSRLRILLEAHIAIFISIAFGIGERTIECIPLPLDDIVTETRGIIEIPVVLD